VGEGKGGRGNGLLGEGAVTRRRLSNALSVEEIVTNRRTGG
jgi:hypothetical protein